VRNKEDAGTAFAVMFDNIYGELNLRPNDIVLDAGANIGTFSLAIANQVKHVYALEPNAANYRVLHINLQINEITNVTPLPLALGGKEGFGKMIGRNASSHLVMDKAEPEVKVVTLDNLCSLLGIPYFDVIKMDIEGAESWVLNNQQTLLGTREIILEAHGENALQSVNMALSYAFVLRLVTPVELFKLSVRSWKKVLPFYILGNIRMGLLDFRRYLTFFSRNLVSTIPTSCGGNFIVHARRRIYKERNFQEQVKSDEV
jgi:FkbM family methyltransferase